MSLRRVVSLTALFSCSALLLTSVVLYIVPAGRVAYWAGWRLWGLSKEQWTAVHINLGVLFLLAVIVHIWLNWAAILSYLKRGIRKLTFFSSDFFVSLVLTLVVCVGTLAKVPPLSSIVELGDYFSERANIRYGEPPYGHAELSPLADFAEKIDVDLEAALQRLSAANIRITDTSRTVQEIALSHGMTPQEIYLIVDPSAAVSPTEMPEKAPAGTGKRSLTELCEMYRLDCQRILNELTSRGFQIAPDLPLKDAAAANGMDPYALYEEIQRIARSQ